MTPPPTASGTRTKASHRRRRNDQTTVARKEKWDMQKFLMLAVALLQSDPANPRTDAQADEPMGLDIKRRGCQVPLIVRRNGDVYLILDGHRRWLSAKLVGVEELPCVVVEGDMTPGQ